MTKPAVERKKAAVKALDGSVSIHPDNPDCIPVADGRGGFDIKIGTRSDAVTIPPRVTFKLDCGFSVTTPDDVLALVTTDPGMSEKGLVLCHDVPAEADGRFTVFAHNVGKQILAFQPHQVIGKLHFVPKKHIALSVKK